MSLLFQQVKIPMGCISHTLHLQTCVCEILSSLVLLFTYTHIKITCYCASAVNRCDFATKRAWMQPTWWDGGYRHYLFSICARTHLNRILCALWLDAREEERKVSINISHMSLQPKSSLPKSQTTPIRKCATSKAQNPSVCLAAAAAAAIHLSSFALVFLRRHPSVITHLDAHCWWGGFAYVRLNVFLQPSHFFPRLFDLVFMKQSCFLFYFRGRFSEKLD